MWQHWLFDVITGDRVCAFDVSPESSWEMRMNSQIGQHRLVIPTASKRNERLTVSDWGRFFTSWRYGVVGLFEDAPVWAGVVSGEPTFSSDGTLSVPAAELPELLKRRLFFGAGAYWPERSETFGPYSRVGMFNAIVRHVCGGGAGAKPGGGISPWRVPVWTDTPQSGGWTWTAEQHKFERPWQKLLEIAESGLGLDFVFAPGFWSGGSAGESDRAFQWVLHAGQTLERSVHRFDLTAPKSPVSAWSVTADASQQETGVFLLGEGSGSARPVGMATPSDSLRMPAMDIAVAAPKQAGVSTLDGLAEQMLASYRHPRRVWTMTVDAEQVLAPMHGGDRDGLRPGSRVVADWSGHRVLGTGSQQLMVTGMSGSPGSRSVDVEVQSL